MPTSKSEIYKNSKKEELYQIKTFEEDFPHYHYFKQNYIGIKEIEIEKIIGCSIRRKGMFNADFTIIEPDRRYLNLLKIIEDSGIESTRKTIEDLGKNLPIQLTCVNVNDRLYYYVFGDGHRRISLAKKFNVKKINAEITEFIVEDIFPILEKNRVGYRYFYKVKYYYDKNSSAFKHRIIEKLGRVLLEEYKKKEEIFTRLVDERDYKMLKEYLIKY